MTKTERLCELLPSFDFELERDAASVTEPHGILLCGLERFVIFVALFFRKASLVKHQNTATLLATQGKDFFKGHQAVETFICRVDGVFVWAGLFICVKVTVGGERIPLGINAIRFGFPQ